ncbi:hypothetical protein [Parahaliea mediterranea]|uniref:DUF2282 domain-containing protein n=1 Tax=Parahaliea mediterranea TaxID=651086 RepID=A0A939DHP5_9GAMM|nr:hypothetical protein [Parahaliea mediterranea]MBN7798294.1 hypothetical protein [Parahaliea mediterranea]
MNLIKTAAAATLLIVSAGSFAAKPTSIVFKGNSETADGTPFAEYTVKCSNGKQMPLTAWDKRRKWCVGEASAENCEKKQIKAAKEACDAA